MKKTATLAALIIAPLIALSLLSGCSSKPKTEAARAVEFLRDLSDEKVSKEFPPAYWEGQCKQKSQIWKNALKICNDGGPHHWMCDIITTMKDCKASAITAN